MGWIFKSGGPAAGGGSVDEGGGGSKIKWKGITRSYAHRCFGSKAVNGNPISTYGYHGLSEAMVVRLQMVEAQSPRSNTTFHYRDRVPPQQETPEE